ncbi:TonB-dependent receptor [Flagellimonas halotolerans]|uniref:isocitrate dehydrogenase (NADP(+)) n=1 Tax=Flagellimonas halotolerans TaxID=3112164 RepID=A0ABU6ITY0_9FLAO|nr:MULTISPECIES: TonB-dependent receptor [unclassified Allomuricauda]MEC3966600.1 TonB-dependent receptor [Muricauda sp. SYSU M86414]MEC4266427.1 TonB-dependent receptor [Muricauda sp. SYSU M84420]
MKKKILTYLLLSLGFTVMAQEKYTIRGTVKDNENGETLIGASVYLQGTEYGTITNEYGFYSLTAPAGTYTLSITYIGFEGTTQEITLNSDQTLDLELSQNATALDEIVVSADDTEKINLKTPQMGVAQLKTQTIKEIPAVLGEVDVIKSIQMLPGVSNNGEGSTGFHVRGGAADQNLVLLDEAIIYNTSHFFGFFSVFNADAIKDVKLYKGDIPAEFGGRVSSVLDVRQKDGNSKNFALSGGIGIVSSRLTAETPIFNNKGSVLVAGRTSYAHLFMKFIDDLKDDKLAFYDLNLKANYEINQNNRIYLSGYFGRDEFILANLITNNYGNATGNLRWNHIFNDRLFANLSLIYSQYDYRIVLDFIGLDWVADIENYNLKYGLNYYVNDKFKLNFGISSILYDLNPGEVTPSNETSSINYLKLDQKKALESAAYIGAENEVTDKLTVQYGLRLSHFSRLGGQSINQYANDLPVVYNEELGIYEAGEVVGETSYGKNESIKTYAQLEPRLALSYQLNDISSVKAGYTRSAQYLHLLSNTTAVTPLDVWTPSGSFIKPQLSNQYSMGYYRTFNDQKYSLEVETYYKSIDNRIDYIDGSNLIGNNTIETEILNGEARSYGMELLLRKNTGKLTGWLGYTLSKSEQRTLGGRAGGLGINDGNWYNAPYDRTHDISLTATYKFNEKWKLSSNFVFQTGRPVTYPNGQYEYEDLSIASYSNRNADRLPAYHRLDVSAIYTPNRKPDKKWKGEWIFGIYNAYNRRNAASITFGQNWQTGENEATRTAIFGIMPAISYNFKF